MKSEDTRIGQTHLGDRSELPDTAAERRCRRRGNAVRYYSSIAGGNLGWKGESDAKDTI